jgi:hypothetical protein
MSRSRSPDPTRVRLLLEALRAGSYIGTACRAAGIGRSTLRRWLERGRSKDEHDAAYREFRREYRAAIAEAEIEALRTIRRAGSEGIAGSWQACAWLLERRFPIRWQRRADPLEQPHPKPLEQMTDQELEDIIRQHDRLERRRR